MLNGSRKQILVLPVNRQGTIELSGKYTSGGLRMSRDIYELQGFAIVLDKVVLVSRVFSADNNEGYQFNITFNNELRLPAKFPTRTEADLARQIFLRALKSE